MAIQEITLLSLMAFTFCLGCKSKPVIVVQDSARGEIPEEKQIALPETKPDDWPITRAEVELLRSDHLKLELKPWNELGYRHRADLVAFARKVLESDLAPIDRDLDNSFSGRIQGAAYQLLGLYGSIEDAARHFQDVKDIVHRGGFYKEPVSDMLKNMDMVRSLGFYLMRDHFMPQSNRELMVEIEDYLLNCTVIGTPSCWPYPDFDNGDDDLRRYALNALAYGCSERTKERLKTYTSLKEPDLFLTEGRYDQEEMEKIEKRGDEIRAKLVPVLPESELSKLESATGRP